MEGMYGHLYSKVDRETGDVLSDQLDFARNGVVAYGLRLPKDGADRIIAACVRRGVELVNTVPIELPAEGSGIHRIPFPDEKFLKIKEVVAALSGK